MEAKRFGIKIGKKILVIGTNQKRIKKLFHEHRAQKGGKVKFFEVSG